MNRIALLLAFFMIASTALAAEKPQTKNKVAAPAPKAIAKPWAPTAFVQAIERLPAGYAGLDPIKFFEMFESKVASLEKCEFETSDDYRKRTASTDAILAPINTSDLYAFQIALDSKYDADAQVYEFGRKTGSCPEQSSEQSGIYELWAICKVANISRENDTYVGSNAYGASRTINRERVLDFALAIRQDSPMLDEVLVRRTIGDGDFEYEYQGKLSIPLEKARNIAEASASDSSAHIEALRARGKKEEADLFAQLAEMEARWRTYAAADVSVLLVGRVTDTKIVKRRASRIEPTFDDPRDVIAVAVAIPFDVKKIIYYVERTGEILGKKDF